MKPLIYVFPSFLTDSLSSAVTSDGDFERQAIVVRPKGETISTDLLLVADGKLYHAARLNISLYSDGSNRVNIDVCQPDGNNMDVLQWDHGKQVLNIRNTALSPLALVISPSGPLEQEIKEATDERNG